MSDAVLKQLSAVLADLAPKPVSFVDPSTYEPGLGWVQIGDYPDLVERAGYRTIDQQVREMIAAGERLQDWREAAYPAALVNGLQAVPVFGDELDVIERYRTLQARRADFKREQEAEAAKQAEAKARAEKGPEPVLVRFAEPPKAAPAKDTPQA